ncbi:polyprenol phosphomannose-dependent alpha 1,6 mannosyltransferase MptB [Nonomuraea sp. NPDC052634]|uniref:polyprenol phosphomannose-dependent alpha 1,6 mannosyltransferase MptB n=1 Tax=Nonomuraea sp. NPDC052634 TaxID=3155813 RepID=UPI00341E936E
MAGPAMVAIAASILLTITIGLLGPSAMVPALTGPAWQPPYSLAAAPEPHLVIVLAVAALSLGGLGLLAALPALSESGDSHSPPAAGHPSTPAPGSPSAPSSERPSKGVLRSLGAFPSPKTLVIIGCVAAAVLAFLPPSGSGDHLNYAAYGRMVTLGLNPYTHGATDLPGDPIADAVEEPWREEPSVYGPVATALQAVASWIGGDSVRLTMFVLALFNAAAFIATGLLIDRFTRHDPRRRLRAALLWTANPLLLYHLVAGMHVDTLAIACMVAALLARGRPASSGVLLGLGVAIKVNAGLVALGPAWELRRRPGRLALMAGCAVAVVVIGYAIVGLDALAPITRTSKAISHASFWKLVQGWLQAIVGTGSAYRGPIQVGSLLVLALIAWSLLRLAVRTGWTSARGPLPRHLAPSPPTPVPASQAPAPASSQGAVALPPQDGLAAPPSQGAVALPPQDGLAAPPSQDAAALPQQSAALPPDPASSPQDGVVPSQVPASPSEGSAATSRRHGSLAGRLSFPRLLGWSSRAAGPEVVSAGRGLEAPVVAMALVVAYLFATPYILPWYDGLALGMLVLVGASALDGLVVAHLLALSLAYLPARVEGQPEDLEWLRTVVRPQIGWALLALTVALVVWAWRAAGRERRRPA